MADSYRTTVKDGQGWVLKEDADAVRDERDRLRDLLESIFDAARQSGDAALFNVVKHAEIAQARRDGE